MRQRQLRGVKNVDQKCKKKKMTIDNNEDVVRKG